MWIRWKKDGSSITTIDSANYAPIYGYGNKIGVHYNGKSYLIDNYVITLKKWQCVIVYGGDNCSRFYIGDLMTEPSFVGIVNKDISGQETYRIGNLSQGPGDVGCIIVYNQHESMDALIELYYESIWLMGNNWNKKQIESVKR